MQDRHSSPHRDARGQLSAPTPGVIDALRDVESVTDAALARLGPQELLEALVERVRQALDADTTAVLLLDHGAGCLVATAASGLEEEVQQGVRVPVGQGFAGRIAAEDRCVILDEVDHTKVVNPLLLDKGIRSLLGAPLRSAGKVIGVMHVGTLSPRRFTSHDVNVLQIAADRAATAVQALSAQTDRDAVAALHRSLIPSALPEVPGLAMAARYAPGSGTVGGDWYDAFLLPSGQVCAVVGDVAGSGLAAAVVMGRMRSALRSYALETSDPAEILERLDRKMRHFEPDAAATVLCAVFSRDLDHVLVASAGHPPPLLAVPGESPYPAPVISDPLIGGPPADRRHSSIIELPQGAMLCLYTDGLVERRGWPVDDGIARLCKAIRNTEVEACCASAMTTMADVGPYKDDIALLVLHRTAGRGQAAATAGQGRSLVQEDARIRWSGRHAVVTMPTELDATTVDEFYELLACAARQVPDILTVDLTSTVFCDSSGLNSLVRARRIVRANGGELRVALGGSPVRRAFELIGLGEVIAVYGDVSESLGAPKLA